jgi:hypothetical protein
MLRRLIRWDIIQHAEYVLVDESKENIDYASGWIRKFAMEAGLSVAGSGMYKLRLFDNTRDIQIQMEHADAFEFAKTNNRPADLLIAHSFLDLIPLPESLTMLLTLTNNLAWLTINFDGLTSLEPAVDPVLDERIERLYHETMNVRATGGDSKSGRHMFGYLQHASAKILAAGASDWVVYAANGNYPNDEAYFLQYILNFFENVLRDHQALNADEFADWLKRRRAQIERGELVYIAHQLDFLVRV